MQVDDAAQRTNEARGKDPRIALQLAHVRLELGHERLGVGSAFRRIQRHPPWALGERGSRGTCSRPLPRQVVQISAAQVVGDGRAARQHEHDACGQVEAVGQLRELRRHVHGERLAGAGEHLGAAGRLAVGAEHLDRPVRHSTGVVMARTVEDDAAPVLCDQVGLVVVFDRRRREPCGLGKRCLERGALGEL